MKKLYLLSFLLFTCKISPAQNLVPNGDFENFGTVPCGWISNIVAFSNALPGWTSPTSGTPDIHSTLIANNCSNFHPHTLYSCSNGSQMPHSGNIFSGFYTMVAGGNREYIQTHLSSPMVPGTKYYVSFYVSLGEESEFATNMGVGFSSTSTQVNTYQELGYAPQIIFPNIITDTANWVLMTDSIVPTQAFEYFIIGNFFHDSLTSLSTVNPTACWPRSYYYCDDVCISVSPTFCPSWVSINKSPGKKDIQLFPIPFSNTLQIKTGSSRPMEISLYDIASQKIFNQQFTGFISLNTSHISSGIYFYEVRNKKEIIEKGKIIKE